MPLAPRLLLLALLTLAHVTPAAAQLGAGQRPAETPLELPEPESVEPARVPVLPPLPPPIGPERERLGGLPVIVLRALRFEGNTVFDAEELEAAAAPWLGRRIGSEDLVGLRDAITQLYTESGYVTSGAVIPDQRMRGGELLVRIVEGGVEEIRIEPGTRLRAGYLRDRIRRGIGAPLQIRDLERQIQILTQDANIDRIDARLEPGLDPSAALFSVKVTDARIGDVLFAFDNAQPPSVGEYQGTATLRLRNPTGFGDVIDATLHGSEGLTDFLADYTLPFTRWDTTLLLHGRVTAGEVVSSAFAPLDIETLTGLFRIGVRQPVWRTPRSEVALGVVADWRRSQTRLLDVDFSFPGTGAVRGRSTLAVVRLTQEGLFRDARQALAIRSIVSFGTEALDATVRLDGEPDAHFVAWLLQARWARRLDAFDLETLVRFDAQVASSPLMPLEQIAVGGFYSVRGYRENLLVRDEGVIASGELRWPAVRRADGSTRLRLSAFVDGGYAVNHRRFTPSPETIWSAGFGLFFEITQMVALELYWAHPFFDTPATSSPQERGVYFRFTFDPLRGR